MRKDMLGKTLVMGVVILFIGVGVQPSFAIESKSTIDTVIRVHVEEIYGTIEDPQYRPLPNVTVEIKIWDLIYWYLLWKGTTDESGKTEDVHTVWGLSHKVMVSKEDYHTYKCRPVYGFITEPGVFLYEVYFTMAEDGSPFNETKSSAGTIEKVEDCDCQSVSDINLRISHLID